MFAESKLAASMSVTRRAFIAGGLLSHALMLPPGITLASSGPKVATLDWALLETLLKIGANVVAAPELRQFREVVIEPSVPSSVTDLGLRGLPNLETLFFSKPDIIFNSNFYTWADPLLSNIAPTHQLNIYVQGQSPFELAQAAAIQMGEMLNLNTRSSAYVHGVNDQIEQKRQKFRDLGVRKFLLINIGDARHYRVFGEDSIFGAMLKRLGFENAWTGATAYSATAPMGIETLAAMPDCWFVLIPPHPLDAIQKLNQSPFWRALPAVQNLRVLTLGSINHYGALPSAERFVDELSNKLARASNAE